MLGHPPRDRESSGINPDVLMQGYQNGDPAATAALIAYVSPALHRFFRVHSGDRQYADDLLQDTWLRIHKVRHTYWPGEPVLPWLYAIARHVRVDAYRKRRFARHEELRAEVPDAAVPPTIPHENLPDMDALLAQLPPGQREVISMMKISGLSLEEVARATSSTTGAVKQKAHRAYERLRGLLSDL